MSAKLSLPILQTPTSWAERLFSCSEFERRQEVAKLDPLQGKDLDRALSLYGVKTILSNVGANPKIAKGKGRSRYIATILHLAPSTVAIPYSSAARDVCRSASPACRSACLNCAGHGGIALDSDGLNDVQVARIRRTVLLWEARDLFVAALRREIVAFSAKARRAGYRPALRLNGTSDLPWLAALFAKEFPRIMFYDYTKHANAEKRELPNYRITFSLSENNEREALRVLNAGSNVAVVFRVAKSKALPRTWQGYRVIDGDLHDMRFLDPRGVVVGLRAKGPAKKDRSGFVRE